MSGLVDTNVLLRRMQPGHPLHTVATESIARLFMAGEDVCFTSQNIAEFWSVATRPIANNGFGFDSTLAWRQVELIERLFAFLPDTPAVYAEWKRLVAAHGVMASKVHDARLVATMNVHGVKIILTFNTDDFKRYATDAIHPVEVVHPSAVL